jgi:hypothetical protein
MENIGRYARLIGVVVATAATVGLLANLNDIKRCVPILSMM